MNEFGCHCSFFKELKMMENFFSWIPYFEDLADEINQQYEKNSQDFPTKLWQMVNHARVSVSLPPWEKGADTCIPPLFYTFVNGRRLSREKRIGAVKAFFKQMSVDIVIKEDMHFYGVPSWVPIKDQTESYPESAVEDFWKFWGKALKLVNEEQNNLQLNDEFKTLFESISKLNGFKRSSSNDYKPRSLSIILYYIRPNYYLPLDEKTCKFLDHLKIKEWLPYGGRNKIDGEKYLSLLSDIHASLNSGDLFKVGIHSIPELSYKAHLYSIDKGEKEVTDENKLRYWCLRISSSEFTSLKKESNSVTDFSVLSEKRKHLIKKIRAEDEVMLCEDNKEFPCNVFGFCKAKIGSDGEEVSFSPKVIFQEALNLLTEKNRKSFKNKKLLFPISEELYNDLLRTTSKQKNLKTNEIGSDNNEATYKEEDIDAEVFLSKKDIQTILRLLKYKKNVILQGPPGTGKTFLAEKIAYTLLGGKANSRIKKVQFHPSYSYEDFIIGYRPSGDSFELQEGIFYKFCDQAKKDPAKKYVFIIDEINRGNLAKVFGELLMLIEQSHRGEEIRLPYQRKNKEGVEEILFSIPQNVYLIGTMNTADRSLALLDYALRRRFSFFEINSLIGKNSDKEDSEEKDFQSSKFGTYVAEISKKVPLFGRLIEVIRKINDDLDKSLGSGFQIGHSYFCNLDKGSKPDEIEKHLRDVVDYEIKPILMEYWYDDIEKYKNIVTNFDNLFPAQH